MNSLSKILVFCLSTFVSNSSASAENEKVYVSFPIKRAIQEEVRLKRLPFYKNYVANSFKIRDRRSKSRRPEKRRHKTRLGFYESFRDRVRTEQRWSPTVQEQTLISVRAEIQRLKKMKRRADGLRSSQIWLNMKDSVDVDQFVAELKRRGFDAEKSGYSEPLSIPTDGLLSEQWAMGNDFGIHALEYWSFPKSDSILNEKVSIAVIDSGVNYDHPDFWNLDRTKTRLLDGINLMDDEEGLPPEDNSFLGHGTVVSGVIAAMADNDTLFCEKDRSCTMVGVLARDENVSLLPIRIYNLFSVPMSKIVEGIYAAVDAGAWVINLSLGGMRFSRSEKNAIEYAMLNDVVVVAAAGNHGVDVDLDVEYHYPSGYNLPNILSVGGVDASGFFGGGSNYGKCTVDLLAPAADVLTTFPMRDWTKPRLIKGSGTSLAAPIVSAAVGIIRSQFPTLNQDEVIYSIRKGVRKEIQRESHSLVLSEGRLNLVSALEVAERLFLQEEVIETIGPDYCPNGDFDDGDPILPSSESSDSKCFIATAAYGSPYAGEVALLRKFRDKILARNPIGRWIIDAYYWSSPPLARVISKSETLRSVTRVALKPVVWGAKRLLDLSERQDR